MKQQCGNCVFYEPAWDGEWYGYCEYRPYGFLPVAWKRIVRLVKTTAQSGRTCKCYLPNRLKEKK